ncbi:hypothetical protein TNCV_2578541 [Trichonephila clavipes]|nr:hypothetical protein TNCV_2578541 [Trichonephila clavipes]
MAPSCSLPQMNLGVQGKSTDVPIYDTSGFFSKDPADTLKANYVQFWFRRFRSSIFDVKKVHRTDRLVVENIDKITEIIEVGQYVSSRSIPQELKMDYKTKPFEQSSIQKETRCLGATQINTKKHDGSNFHLGSPGQTEGNRPIF